MCGERAYSERVRFQEYITEERLVIRINNKLIAEQGKKVLNKRNLNQI